MVGDIFIGNMNSLGGLIVLGGKSAKTVEVGLGIGFLAADLEQILPIVI